MITCFSFGWCAGTKGIIKRLATMQHEPMRQMPFLTQHRVVAGRNTHVIHCPREAPYQVTDRRVIHRPRKRHKQAITLFSAMFAGLARPCVCCMLQVGALVERSP